jgi:putative inorganic carbon (HCO3(-)) transporter
MLRTIFVAILLTVGAAGAFSSPLYAAGLYLWIAYFRPESWVYTNFFASLYPSFVAGVFLLIRTLVAGVSLRPNWRSMLLVVFLALSAASAVNGVHRDVSFLFLQTFAKTIIVSYVLTAIIQTQSDLRFVLMVIAGSLGFEAAKQGWAQLVLNPGAQNDNTIPFLGDNNLVAVGIAMLVPLVSALAATSSSGWKRLLQFLNVGVVYRALSTYSRGGFLSIGAVASVIFVRSRHKIRALVTAALIASLIVPALPHAFWDRMSTIAASDEERDESQAGRLHFWRVAIVMANDRPILGVGHAGYQSAYDQYDWSGGRYKTGRAVHSSWFGILAETGYLGFALFLLIVVSSFWSCRRVRMMAKRGEVSASLGHYATGLESSLIAFVVGGTFVSFHYNEMLWHFFALTVALERVAMVEAVAVREQRQQAVQPAAVTHPTEDFVWA